VVEQQAPHDGICIVLGAMPITAEDADEIRAVENQLLICADAGYEVAVANGLIPTMTIGDLDSFSSLPERFLGVLQKHPVEKDDTDTMLAAKEGLARGYRQFLFFGSLGGRLDHTYANIVTLRYLLDFGATGWIVSKENRVTMLKNGSLTLGQDARYPHLSVFSYEATASGVVVDGGKYTPVSHSLYNNFPLGVSNSIVGQTATVRVDDGILLIILAR